VSLVDGQPRTSNHTFVSHCCRVVSTVQLVAFVVYSLFWVAVLDYVVFLFACDWSNIRAPMHVHWTTHSECWRPEVLHHVLQHVFCMCCFALRCKGHHHTQSLCIQRCMHGGTVYAGGHVKMP
jgi:hypothetical protein